VPIFILLFPLVWYDSIRMGSVVVDLIAVYSVCGENSFHRHYQHPTGVKTTKYSPTKANKAHTY